MIDFTSFPKRNKGYAGANGNKISIVYNDEVYMIKFPPPPTKNKEMSYTNSCICEYIGCHIFELIGIPVQKTMLGTYTVNGKEKIVVACKDFTFPGKQIQDFASLKNQVITSPRGGYGTELADVLYAIEDQNSIDHHALTERFWDMFIVDALIGNWDRHNGNWGFLYDEATDSHTLAPVFDCGSSMYPQADADIMEMVLGNKGELNYRIYENPTSALQIDGKRIKYYDYIVSLENEDCNAALKRIMPRIDLHAMCNMINEIPCISDLQKRFYTTLLSERKEKILDHAYHLLLEKEKEHSAQKPSVRKQLADIQEKRSSVAKGTKKKDDRDAR